MSRKNGFTLVETLMVIVIVGLLGLIAVPRLTAAKAQSDVQGVRARVAAIYSAARTEAVSSGRTATVKISANKIWAEASPRRKPGAGTVDTIIRPENMMTTSKIALTPTTANLSISPSGLGQNASNVVITATKGSHSASMTVNKYGRVVR